MAYKKGNINLKINEIAEYLFAGNNSEFARATGFSEANIRNYRKDIEPKLPFISVLHDKLEISYEWLIDDIGEMKKKSFTGATSPQSVEETTDKEVMTLLQEIKGDQKTILISLNRILSPEQKGTGMQLDEQELSAAAEKAAKLRDALSGQQYENRVVVPKKVKKK